MSPYIIHENKNTDLASDPIKNATYDPKMDEFSNCSSEPPIKFVNSDREVINCTTTSELKFVRDHRQSSLFTVNAIISSASSLSSTC